MLTGVSDVMATGNAEARRQKLDELMHVFARYGCLGAGPHDKTLRHAARVLETNRPKQKRRGNHMSNVQFSIAVALSALGLSACAHAAGTEPHEMSTAQHQAAAAQEENQASQHAAQHDPNSTQTNERCVASRGRVCWTETSNPTEGHRHDADKHRELAAQHRAASKALQHAETRACTGLSDEDRDVSPFAHGADIVSVSQLREDHKVGRTTVARDAGATVVFRAAPGLTAEWLQRIVDCHLARNAAVGHDMPEMSYCPLVPRGAQAKVHSVGNGFAVDVRSDDSATAAEIWRRAQQITPAS